MTETIAVMRKTALAVASEAKLRREHDEVEGDEREDAVCDVIAGEIGEDCRVPETGQAWSCRFFLVVKFGLPVGVDLEQRA